MSLLCFRLSFWSLGVRDCWRLDLPIKTKVKETLGISGFPCPSPPRCLSLSAAGPHFPLVLLYLQKPFQLLFASLTRFNFRWALGFFYSIMMSPPLVCPIILTHKLLAMLFGHGAQGRTPCILTALTCKRYSPSSPSQSVLLNHALSHLVSLIPIRSQPCDCTQFHLLHFIHSSTACLSVPALQRGTQES